MISSRYLSINAVLENHKQGFSKKLTALLDYPSWALIYWANSDGGISEPVMILWYWHETKLDKRNTSTSKKIDDYVMSANCDLIVFIPIYGQFTVIRKPRSGRMVYKVSLFINNNLIKTESRTKKSLTKLSNYCFE